MASAKESRVARSIRLTSSINERLDILCEHLGVTANAYLVQAIGKAITQDELHFKLGKSTDGLGMFLQNATDILNSNTAPEEKQLPLEKDL